jgi:nucleotide-binding universal stress UspA family protein
VLRSIARRGRPAPGPAAPRRVRRILLANVVEGWRPDVLAEAATLANEHGAKVSVLQVLRIWGTGLGLPHPGLQPNREERLAASDAVDDAVAFLTEHGVTLSGQQVIKTRKPAKVIAAEATRLGCDLVVVGAPRGGRRGDWSWPGQAHRVHRHTAVPVRVVLEGDANS